LAARCGLLTASEVKSIMSLPPKVETRVKKNGEPYKQREWNPVADNDDCRAHLFELMSQRITGYVEPSYITDAMLRGQEDEIHARALYAEKIAPVTEVGFITNDKWGFTLGYSPDGLVGDDGLIECKSRRMKFQAEMIADLLPEDEIFPEFQLQAQTGLLVSERSWLDHISYCGGMPMTVVRVHPDKVVQGAILEAAAAFEARLGAKLAKYHAALANTALRTFPTERKVEQEMYV